MVRKSFIERPAKPDLSLLFYYFRHEMSNKKLVKRMAWSTVLVLLMVIAVFSFIIYKRIFTPNVSTGKRTVEFVFIPTGSTFDDVVTILDRNQVLINEKTFRWTAHQMNYDIAVRPGKYKISSRMNNKQLISLLRSGQQTPVKVIFNNIRTKQQLADRISEQIEASSSSINNLLNDKDYTGRIGFNPDNILAMFIPNTYEFYWNTSADKFIQKMAKEYKKFWNADKVVKARNMKLTQVQVSVLASIVQMESNREDEKPIIAGVYYNRFIKDWKLEADPTLVYALGDFSISRVLNIYKEIESPYNTYRYKGLPPGPICLPTVNSINAVLNYAKHNYMYFCAKDDFSGHHAFASSYAQHLINAHKFQSALNKRGIRS